MALADATRLSSQKEWRISSRNSGVENGYFSLVDRQSRNLITSASCSKNPLSFVAKNSLRSKV
ncbi:hypothetical protein D3C72_834370 [compost metagenome]